MFSSHFGDRATIKDSLFEHKGMRHHPDFRNTQGWKSVHKEKDIPYEKYPNHLFPVSGYSGY